LVGRPNAGKSSLFNRLTGGNAHVGNFPGVTVDVLEARVRLPDGKEADAVDLPGVYSLEATVDPATDEGVARAFLSKALEGPRPVVLVQVLDATQMALGLRLTSELLRVRAPFVVVATQRDALERLGRRLDAKTLSESLGTPAVAVSAREPRTRACVLRAVQRVLETWTEPGPVSTDGLMNARGGITYADTQRIARRVVHDDAVRTRDVDTRRQLTGRLDSVLLSHPLGAIIFLAIMAALFTAVFLIADPVSRVFDWSLGLVSAAVLRHLGHSLAVSFFTDAVLGGAGTVLTFVPQIVVLTMLLELLDASGYLARGAFIADRMLRVLGLGGRSFVPLLLGHACAIPAIAATRVIRNPQERLVTLLVIPLMTCSARIPTYALILGAFFANVGALGKAAIFVSLYALGGLFGLLASILLRRKVVRGKSLPLVMEMPSYRWPEPLLLLRKGWQAATGFARSAGTTILAASAALWLLLHIPVISADSASPEPATTHVERSMAAAMGRALEPVTKPLGFDWRINVGLIGSFGSREMMVGTLGVIHGVEASEDRGPLSQRLREAKAPNGLPAYSTRTGLAILAFFVVACQCISTVVAVSRETKTLRWPLFVVGYTYTLGYLFALAASTIAARFGL
jgi:ferrous iron transport protein B